jgi:hypothetical protein
VYRMHAASVRCDSHIAAAAALSCAASVDLLLLELRIVLAVAHYTCLTGS